MESAAPTGIGSFSAKGLQSFGAWPQDGYFAIALDPPFTSCTFQEALRSSEIRQDYSPHENRLLCADVFRFL